MSIKDLPGKIKSFGGEAKPRVLGLLERQDVFVTLVVLLVATASFGLGRISVEKSEKTGIQIEGQVTTFSGLRDGKGTAVIPSTTETATVSSALPSPTSASPQSHSGVFASKNGKKYYYPNCASRVGEANKVWFDTPAKAEALGFTLASNCKI